MARKGGGKTFQLKQLLRAERKTCVLFDVKGEYPFPDTRAKWPGTTYVVRDIDALDDCLVESIEEKKKRIIVFVPGEAKRDIAEFCDLIYIHYRCIAVAFEEMPAYTEPGSMPIELDRLVLQGRSLMTNEGKAGPIDFYFVGQRYAEMNRTITAQCDFHVVGSTKEPNDLAALEKRIGTEGTAQVAALPPREFITFDVAAYEVRKGVSLEKEAGGPRTHDAGGADSGDFAPHPHEEEEDEGE